MAPKSHTCHWHIIERSPERKKKVSVQRKGGASSAHFSNELLNRLCHRPTEANSHLSPMFLLFTEKQIVYLILILDPPGGGFNHQEAKKTFCFGGFLV